MKYLGIDYGQKRTGIAVTDPGGSMAFPRCTLAMHGKDAFFAELLALIEQEQPGGIVVGLPLYLDGTESETTRQVRNMVARLKRRCPLPVYMVEEALSSFDAEEQMKAAGADRKKRKECLDQAAAVAILESFLSLPDNRRLPL